MSDALELPPELADPLVSARLGLRPFFEEILASEPDPVLVAWGEVREKLEHLGIPVVTGGGAEGWLRGVLDVFAVILLVGRAVGVEERAEALVGKPARGIVVGKAKLLDRPPKKSAVFLCFLSPDSPPFAARTGTPEHKLLLRAGGENLFGDVSGCPKVSLEGPRAYAPRS